MLHLGLPHKIPSLAGGTGLVKVLRPAGSHGQALAALRIRCGNAIFFAPFLWLLKTEDLPRQARDKHRESTQKETGVFYIGGGCSGGG